MTSKKQYPSEYDFDDTEDESHDTDAKLAGHQDDPTVIEKPPEENQNPDAKKKRRKTKLAPNAKKAPNKIPVIEKLKFWLYKVRGAISDMRFDLANSLERTRLKSWLLKMMVVGLGVAVILVVGMMLASDDSDSAVQTPDMQDTDEPERPPSPPTLRELRRMVKANPKDAQSKLLLGHALFSKGRRDKALWYYGKALGSDSEIADPQLVSNLITSFGSKIRSKVAKLIAKHKITDASGGLRKYLKNKNRAVRAKALQTLTKIRRATRADRVVFYIQDLQAKNCDIRLRAVTKLGNLGDKRAISALQVADKKDKHETPWYRSSCLGDAPEDAVENILKRRK